MRPSFNIAGPCFPGEHYMVSPERRLKRVLRLLEDGKYFTLHAGRQVGKTTCAFWLVEHLPRVLPVLPLWVDIQTAREQPDPASAFRTILNAFDTAIEYRRREVARPTRDEMESLLRDPGSAIIGYLRAVQARAPAPLVILIDEADGLVGPAMVSFLTQLRDGYIARSTVPFPPSIVLIGQRQVRDFVLDAEDRRALSWLGTTSPFNITAEATTIDAFTSEEVAELLGQHTVATGQRFDSEAVERIWELAQGHPWLTNALADQTVVWDVEDRTVPITAAHIEAAKETIILERRSHIDSLVARLREPRVRRILEPMLVGSRPADPFDDDLAYVAGLGLVVTRRGGMAEIPNAIYREVIPRALTWAHQMTISQETAWYVRRDGTLDMEKLLRAFQVFWREDGHLAAEGFAYREAGPHLMLMAFLQRIVNSGGRIEREYGIGRGALDLMVFWAGERHAIEVKLRRDTETEERALAQVGRYLDGTGLCEGWLVLFDLRKEIPWSEKLTVRDVDVPPHHIRIVGC